VRCRIVRQLLKKHGFVRRLAQKKKSFKQHPERNPQFENITALKAKYLAANQPVLSMGTKKKEMLGNSYRNGKLYTRETIEGWIMISPATARERLCRMACTILA